MKSPRKTRPRINLAQSLAKKGLFPAAIEEYQHAELLALEDPDPFRVARAELHIQMNITDLMLRSHRDEEAHQILKQAWLAAPGFPGYAANLSVYYLRQNEPDKALFFLNEGIARLRDYPWFVDQGILYFNRGEAYRLKGDCLMAHANYQVSARFASELPEAPACGGEN